MASGGIAITRESHGRQVNQIVGEGMKACVLQAPAPIETNPLHFTEVAVPRPGPGEILVRVRACGVCRTDLHVVEGELPPRKSPIIPGHQIVGVVEELGAEAHRFSKGARVGIAWLHRTDGTCEYCRAGTENLCDHPSFTGYTVDEAMPSSFWPRRILSIPFRRRFRTAKRRQCYSRASSGFDRCAF